MSFQDKDGNTIMIGDSVTWDNTVWKLESEMATHACLRSAKNNELATAPYKNIALYKKEEQPPAATNMSQLAKEEKGKK